jgi:hypothetical protein
VLIGKVKDLLGKPLPRATIDLKCTGVELSVVLHVRGLLTGGPNTFPAK